MARTNNLTNFLTDVSAAIKQKTGDNTPIPASDFDTEILSIETAGNYQSKTLNVTQNGNYNLLPDQDYDAMSNVNISVNVPTGEDLDAVITAQEQKLTQLEAILQSKASGGSEPNIFVQDTEPSKKKGIWLQTNKTAEHYISDNDVYTGGEWASAGSETNIPYAFRFGSAISIGTDIYLFGSEDDQTKAYKYNTLTDTYTRLTDIPFSFHKGSIALVGTDIYLFFGTNNYKYNTLTDTYTKMADIPYSYYGGSTVTIGTNIYLFGCETYKTRVYIYNTSTDTYTPSTNIPYNFAWGNAIVINTNVYLLGGYDNSTYNYKYDTLTDTYTKMTDIPFRSFTSAATLLNNDIYIFGGSRDTTACYKYNTLTDTYTQLTNIPYNFENGSSVAIGVDIYLLGGETSKYTNRKYIVTGKTYSTDNTVVIAEGTTYSTELFDTNFETGYKLKNPFSDVFFYTTQDGLMTNIPSYYGDGTQWVNFKNPPQNQNS